jgi:hypothetical protein
MQIPAQLPELNVPLTSRTDLPPIQPVEAVPGVAELTQLLDPRLALSWAQPVLQNEESTALKNTQETLTPPPKPVNAAALLELDSLPQSDGTQWIGRWLSALTSSQQGEPVSWPVASSPLNVQPSTQAPELSIQWPTRPLLPAAQQAIGQMQGLFAALVQSPLFASQRLARHEVLGTVAPGQADPSLSGGSVQMPEQKPQNSSQVGRQEAHHLRHAPQQHRASSLQSEQLSPDAMGQERSQDPVYVQRVLDMAALEPDSEAARQAALCLTSGNMVWQGSLSSGLPAQIRREDAWRESPANPGQLDKGVTLTVETEFPRLGKLRVGARPWGGEQWISIALQGDVGAALQSELGSLQERLGEGKNMHIDMQDWTP